MPYLSEKKKVAGTKYDARRKLSEEDKAEIKRLYDPKNWSTRKLATRFNVSKRTIQFVIDPQKRLNNYKKRVENGGSQQYYDRESHNLAIKKLRRKKQKLTLKGEL